MTSKPFHNLFTQLLVYLHTLVFLSSICFVFQNSEVLIHCQVSCHFHQNERAITPHPSCWQEFPFLNYPSGEHQLFQRSPTQLTCCLLWAVTRCTKAHQSQQGLVLPPQVIIPPSQILYQQVSASTIIQLHTVFNEMLVLGRQFFILYFV